MLFFSCANLCTWLICFDRKKCSIKFWILVFFVSLQPQNRNNLLLGYGVMVTLQILVLSFLVRVQIAQQKENALQTKSARRSLFVGSFQIMCRYGAVPDYSEDCVGDIIAIHSEKTFFYNGLPADITKTFDEEAFWGIWCCEHLLLQKSFRRKRTRKVIPLSEHLLAGG